MARRANGTVTVAARNRLIVAERDRLTSRERQIASLAARGLSDREIASQLKVSAGTIKTHLHIVYQKLGITGRRALKGRANEL